MHEVVIVAATRTAIGAFQGALANIPASELGACVIRALLESTGLDPARVDEVILGQVLSAGCGQNPARQAALLAGLPHGVPALTLNKVCGSGLKALHLAAQAIRCGDAEVVIAGGMENMSQAPYLLPQARSGLRLGHGQIVDSLLHDGLWDAFNDYHMGITAENLAARYAISREEQDAFAAASQQKACAALAAGRFAAEITPVPVPQRKGEVLRFAVDEQPRAETSAASLAGLRPAFKKDGSVTAGNAFFAPNQAIVPELEAYMDALRKSGDSVGARINVVASGVPVGWGEPVYDRLDADIAYAMMSINAVKGVEIGAGFASVAQLGTQHSDEMSPEGFLSNQAGGVLGGISTGQDVVVSMAIKPTSSTRLDRQSIDKAGEPVVVNTHGRHDPCVGIRATPIAEAMLAIVLMDHALRHRAQNADVTTTTPRIAGLAPAGAQGVPSPRAGD